MEAVKGDLRDHHFRHADNRKCGGGLETAIHFRAKQIIANNSVIEIPGRQLTYCNVRVENKLNTKKPDATVSVNGEDVHFEIRVTNAVKKEKRSFYCNGKHKCVEINLSDKELWQLGPEELERLVLGETNNKGIIYWPQERIEAVEQGESLFERLFGIAILIFIVLFFFKLILPRKRY
ncbi:MAG: hypothetical protein JSR71_06620 [Proteobacteria bacterium]|nr:hypothetical protein [Pseudomonadota bacterium]